MDSKKVRYDPKNRDVVFLLMSLGFNHKLKEVVGDKGPLD
jgi:hypothetical protein